MRDTTPHLIIFLGAIGLLAWWIAMRNQPVAGAPPRPEMADYWTTPLYLRANTPVFDTTKALLPSAAMPDDTQIGVAWALATLYGGPAG